jgi:hypothetical protein
MSSSIKAAERVVATINVFKWIVVTTLALAGVIVALAIEFATTLPRITEAGALLAGVLAAMVTWVTFGWRQHTLGMLTVIATSNSGMMITMKGAGAGTLTRSGAPGEVTFARGDGVFGGIHSGGESSIAESNEPVPPPATIRGDGKGGYTYGGSSGTAGTDLDFDGVSTEANSDYQPGR